MTDLSHIVPVLAIVVLVLGMMFMQRRLSVLEDKEHVRKAQELLNIQMRRFAELTMRLLGGEEARTMAPEIAAAIAATTTFDRVTVAFSDGVQMNIVGSAGIAEAESARLGAALEALPI